MEDRETAIQQFLDDEITAEQMVERLDALIGPERRINLVEADEAPLSLVRAHAAVRRIAER